MVSLPMVVRHELVEGAEQATFPEKDQAVETLLSDRAHEPFRVRVGIRRLDGRQHDPHPGALDDAAESVGPLAVAIADEDLVVRQEPIDRIGQSARRLRLGRWGAYGVRPPWSASRTRGPWWRTARATRSTG
jgi:hypothetical protein